jgi:Rab-like protein 5
MAKVVVFLVGPQKTGKTAISNYLADLSESLDSPEYHPTRGVRLVLDLTQNLGI